MIKLIINLALIYIAIKGIFICMTLFVIQKYIKYIKNKKKKTIINNQGKSQINIVKSKVSLKSKIGNTIYGLIKFSISEVGKIPSNKIRTFILRKIYLVNMNKDVVIYNGFDIRDPYKITINEGSIVGDKCILDGRNEIYIGKNVNISTGVWIWTEQHDLQSPYFACNNKGGAVIIEDRAWISCRAIILPGIKIGEGSVIAAGSVVTKDVEPYSVYAGIPARKIGNRNKDLKYTFDGTYLPFC